MRNKLVASALVIAAIVGGWFYFHSRVIKVWVYTDQAFRIRHENWPDLVTSRFNEVNRIYQANNIKVRWKVVDSSEVDPTAKIPGIDDRRANMIFHLDRKTDVYVIISGVEQGMRTGSVNPFTNVAVVVDLPKNSEAVNARSLAHELAHLFGAPQDPAWPEALAAEKPETAQFSPHTVALINRLRDYPFVAGIDGLSQGSWEKKALSALTDEDAVPKSNPAAHAQTVVGTALLNERKRELALVHFEAAVQADPNNLTARLNLAEAYTRAAQDEKALAEVREGVRLAPNDPLAHRALGALLGRTHRPDEAVQELQIAARMDPNSVDTKVMLAIQQSNQFGHLDEGIATFEEALRMAPSSTTAAEGLKRALALKEHIQEDLAQEREAVKRNPNDADAHYRLAKAEAHAGDLSAAIRDFQIAADGEPNSGMPHVELAQLFFLKGDADGAWGEVDKARALGAEPPATFISRLGPKK
jgi:tetratricopeptide (TPR) repeat protein